MSVYFVFVLFGVNVFAGRQLNDTYLTKIGAKQLDGYLDPYHKRPMKMGEIGCFLSHYFIWKEVRSLYTLVIC